MITNCGRGLSLACRASLLPKLRVEQVGFGPFGDFFSTWGPQDEANPQNPAGGALPPKNAPIEFPQNF